MAGMPDRYTCTEAVRVEEGQARAPAGELAGLLFGGREAASAKSPCQRFYVPLLFVFAGLIVVTGLGSCSWPVGRHSSPSASSAGAATQLVDNESRATGQCSFPGQNCVNTTCCARGGASGYQCYQKNQWYATCMEDTCKPGTHEGEKEGYFDLTGVFHPQKWSCKKLGHRSEPDPCSAPGEDCSKTQCCSPGRGAGGMTCYQKDTDYATCKETCQEGRDAWSCKRLGNYTPIAPGCSWAGSDCSETRLCCNPGFSCAVKDATYTGCIQTAQKSTWFNNPVPVPADWEGTVLGGSRSEYEVASAPEGRPVAGVSLYCFMAFLPNTTEETLMWIAKNNSASIFACNDSATFYSWRSGMSAWDTANPSLVNTDVFVNVWDQVKKDGRYRLHDWTVKVDADCVFFPDRLHSHLWALAPPANMPIYVKNTVMERGLSNGYFLGAIEVFSRRAVDTYFDNAEGCRKYLGVNCGEDGFFKGCMDSLGVGWMWDKQMMFPDSASSSCGQGQHVAFHPIKDPTAWKVCLDLGRGQRTNWW